MPGFESAENLASDLDGCMRQYAAVTLTLLSARERIVKDLRFSKGCPNFVRRRKSYRKYEFHNCYGRFYIAVINGRIPFEKVLEKLQSEVREKHLECSTLDACAGVSDLQDFSEKCGILPMTEETVDVDAVVGRIEEEPVDDPSNIKFVHDSDPEYLSLEMTKERYQEMITSAETFLKTRLNVEDCDVFPRATKLFKLCVVCYIMASSPLYWGFGPKVYQFVEKHLNAQLEGYASPFNHTLSRYCSPFSLDMVFGSLGTVYGAPVIEEVTKILNTLEADQPLTLVLNPPYLESELMNCAHRVAELVDLDARIRVLCIVPQWDDAPGIKALRGRDEAGKLKGVLAEDRLLGKYEHYYWDYQKWRPINAKFGSRLLLYSKDGHLRDDERERIEELVPLMKKTPEEEASANERPLKSVRLTPRAT
ncbi:hypothetical protein FOZ60_003853 [Perkinsus olseni]|uniref:PCIF1 WW domain-containing protein n=1 Tax=Perkinsus olseni TaxID=32597 RepID=A0A7J6NVA9_PEROL|nr:hypothetical protein FOZ60_003853 [Perkinsus olseni]